jgi:hypothetical protein
MIVKIYEINSLRGFYLYISIRCWIITQIRITGNIAYFRVWRDGVGGPAEGSNGGSSCPGAYEWV